MVRVEREKEAPRWVFLTTGMLREPANGSLVL